MRRQNVDAATAKPAADGGSGLNFREKADDRTRSFKVQELDVLITSGHRRS